MLWTRSSPSHLASKAPTRTKPSISSSSSSIHLVTSLTQFFLFRFIFSNTEQIAVKSTIIDKETVQRVVSLLLEATEATEETSDAAAAIRVVDAFLIPKYKYDYSRKQFYE